MRVLAILAACAAFCSSANAATVASGATRIGDTGGITLDGAGVAIASGNRAYNNVDIGADWVWGGDAYSVDDIGFSFIFDLTGYDAASAVLSGLWGVDNVGAVFLNGFEIASLVDVVVDNFALNNVYGTDVDNYFNAGLNTLSFALADRGGQAAFRATALVEADASVPAVPLPAGAVLLLSGLGLMALRR